MRNDNIVRWGVLSTSSTAVDKAIPAMQQSDRMVVGAIASRDPVKARAVAERLGIAAAQSYESLLEGPNLDAVYIPLPNSLHADWIEQAAANGKHVVVEKPAIIHPEECRRVTDSCRKHGVLFMEGFTYRFHPQHEFVRQALEDGAIGELRLIRTGFSFTMEERHSKIRLSADLGGGCLWDLGSYAVSLCCRIAGSGPRRVFASGAGTEDGEVEMEAAGMLEFASGARAVFDCAFNQPRRQFCEIVGTEGTIQMPQAFGPSGETEVIVQTKAGRQVKSFPAINQFQAQFEHFSECILSGRAPEITPTQSLVHVETMCALKESLATGSPVALDSRGYNSPSI